MNKTLTISISAAVVIVALSVGYYLVVFLPSQVKMTEQPVLESQEEVSVARQDKESAHIESVLPDSEIDYNSILLNYKIDIQDRRDIMEDLLDISSSNTEGLCSSIIASKTTRSHLYYYAQNNLDILETQYGKYEDDIPYIRNNLNSYRNMLQIVKDRCESLGYYILSP